MVWEAIFLLVILKIPIVYLCCVVYWAIKAEPKPEEGAALLPVVADPDPRPEWSWRPRLDQPRRGGPHGSPTRSYSRGRVPALVRAEVER